MKLLRVDVEHFGCIRRASVELGPGLNVLYGPNDLGKSTLARAIRAALLIQHTSSAATEFVEWDSDESPSVKLTLELPDRRVWRVEKRFGANGGSSVLRESTDGKTFSPYKKAREVDDEIRTQLGWGIASPASKGAPRGLPTSFLATVLLGEQTDVAGVLRQTLDADSDESGRARLTSALAAFAQDPLFKSILEEAQGKVDTAFTSKGGKKKGKSSPFREVTDEVKRVKEELERLARRVAESENARRELEACNEELVRRQEALVLATELGDSLRESKRRLEARRTVEEELTGARRMLDEQLSEVATLREREAQLVEVKDRVHAAKERRESLAAEKERLVANERAAEEALRQARSDEAEQARQLRRGELERRKLELAADAKAIGAEREKVAKARTLHAELSRSEARASDLLDLRNRSEADASAAGALKGDLQQQLELVQVAEQVSQRRRTETAIDELEKVRVEVAADRAKAEELRARANELVAGIPANLPDDAAVQSMRELAHELEVATARLGGGLAVVVERLRPIAIQGTADGSGLELAGDGSISFEASRGFVLQIGDVAKVSVTAGEREDRQRESELRGRWDSEVASVLATLEIPDLATLMLRAEEAASLRRQAGEARSAADSLEERASMREEQLAKLVALQEEMGAIDRELGGKPVADATRILDELDGRSLDAYRAELKRKLEVAQASVDSAQEERRRADTEGQVLAERIGTTRRAIAELGITEPEVGWDAFAVQLSHRADAVVDEQERVDGELSSLIAEQDAQVNEAEAALAEVRETLATVGSRLSEATEELESLREQSSRLEGEIENRRAAVAKLDTNAAEQRVEDLTARLDALPVSARAVTDDEIHEAEVQLAEAERAHDRAKDDVRKAEGGLQMVGGQIVIEEQNAAKDALRQAEQKEREVELDYDAWRLLMEKLREAENTEGLHLGEALSQAVTERFAKLTDDRYGKFEVNPNLHAEGVRVKGVVRAVGALSAGTQEQLATLLRLTVAEQLGSMLILDDHLTQTDPARSAWFRDVLRAHAAKAQVIVLTCRPADYLLQEDLPTAAEAVTSRAAGLVRSIDMSRVIVRGESTSSQAAQPGAE